MEVEVLFHRLFTADDMARTMQDRKECKRHAFATGECQSLCLLNCLRSKNALKQVKVLNF